MISATEHLSIWLSREAEQRGFKAADLDRSSSVSYATWWRLLKGELRGGMLDPNTAGEICRLFSITPQELAKISNPDLNLEAPNPDTDHFCAWYSRQPTVTKQALRKVGEALGYKDENIKADKIFEFKVAGEIAAGRPSGGWVATDELVTVPAEAGRAAGKSGYILRVCGDSMNPGLDDGNLILMRRTTSGKDGDIVAVEVDGEPSLKRLRDGRLTSDNPKYPELLPRERAIIVGRFIHKVVR